MISAIVKKYYKLILFQKFQNPEKKKTTQTLKTSRALRRLQKISSKILTQKWNTWKRSVPGSRRKAGTRPGSRMTQKILWIWLTCLQLGGLQVRNGKFWSFGRGYFLLSARIIGEKLLSFGLWRLSLENYYCLESCF